MTPTLQRYAFSFLGLLLTVALLQCPVALAQQITYGTPGEANATSPEEGERAPSVLDAVSLNPTWSTNINTQIQTLLDSRNHEMQATAVHLIHEIALRAPHVIDNSSLRSRLYDVMYRTSSPDGLRILALSALYNTNPAETVQSIRSAVRDEPSERVKRQMLLTIAAANMEG